ncbi:MAG: GGDEF domain-containing protein, partial [Pseudomonadales bacterium]
MKKSLLRDDLTLIGNRERLELSLHRAHYEYQRRQQAYAVLSLSIDNLEQINAKFGHSAGNEVFAAFVKRTARMLRNTDSFAQASGEDFVITLSHTDEACAIIIAQRLLDANRVNLVPCKEGAINYKLSVGIGNCMSGDLS